MSSEPDSAINTADSAPYDAVTEQDEKSSSLNACGNTLYAVELATKEAVDVEGKETSQPENKNVTSWAEEVEEAETNSLDVHDFSVCKVESNAAEEVIFEDQESDIPNVCENIVDAAESAPCNLFAAAKEDAPPALQQKPLKLNMRLRSRALRLTI